MAGVVELRAGRHPLQRLQVPALGLLLAAVQHGAAGHRLQRPPQHMLLPGRRPPGVQVRECGIGMAQQLGDGGVTITRPRADPRKLVLRPGPQRAAVSLRLQPTGQHPVGQPGQRRGVLLQRERAHQRQIAGAGLGVPPGLQPGQTTLLHGHQLEEPCPLGCALQQADQPAGCLLAPGCQLGSPRRGLEGLAPVLLRQLEFTESAQQPPLMGVGQALLEDLLDDRHRLARAPQPLQHQGQVHGRRHVSGDLLQRFAIGDDRRLQLRSALLRLGRGALLV